MGVTQWMVAPGRSVHIEVKLGGLELQVKQLRVRVSWKRPRYAEYVTQGDTTATGAVRKPSRVLNTICKARSRVPIVGASTIISSSLCPRDEICIVVNEAIQALCVAGATIQ